MAVDARVQVRDDRHGARREARAQVRGRREVLRIARAVLGDGHLERAAVQPGQDVVRPVSGRHHERARRERAGGGGDAERPAVARDRRRLQPLEDLDAARLQRRGQRAAHGRQVDDAGVHVEVPEVRVDVGEAPAQGGRVERLRRQPELLERREAALRVGRLQVGRDGALGEVQAAAADEHVGAGLPLELAPQAERLVRQPRVDRVEVVVAEGARAAVGGGQRVPDRAPLEHHDPLPGARRVVRREQAHHATPDDEQVAGGIGHGRRIRLAGSDHTAMIATSRATALGSHGRG